ncbi:hypothetical protein [Endozoicomonas sp. 8E]|uniref:hypothetical protein n=1 Tax=Endozoicomonas sp. 8E TaxID=3035692 RepID=UPI002938D988|nr:hypothetical protein [Endozoicomonas sp. 8E]WOG30098.1 hypothetical protein P6910_10715 [Endozoicomonas sp. 8E]
MINYGFWYGLCRSPELVSALAGRSDPSGTEQNELQEIKSLFCYQLAAVITSIEVALAGRVSAWPLELHWWQPLRFPGTAYVGYKTYTTCNPPFLIPVVTAAYFTHEVVARTVAGTFAIQALRQQDRGTTQTLDYLRSEYTMLSSMAGLMVGAVVYDTMLAGGFTTAQAISAYLISSVLTERIFTRSSFSTLNSGDTDRVEAGAEVLAGAGAIAGSLAAATAAALMMSAEHSDLVFRGTTFVTLVIAVPTVMLEVCFGAFVGLLAGTQVIGILMLQHSKLDSKHLLKNIAHTLGPALAIAAINGFSNHRVYGYSLEESFTETVRKQWQKFHAPLDYLYTLFN